MSDPDRISAPNPTPELITLVGACDVTAVDPESGDPGVNLFVVDFAAGSPHRVVKELTPDRMPLVAGVLVRTSEPEEADRVQEGLIKRLTEGEPIRVRRTTGVFALFRRVRRRMRSALQRVTGRALRSGGSETVMRGDRVAPPAPNCRAGEGQ